jgi:hypothetical protein
LRHYATSRKVVGSISGVVVVGIVFRPHYAPGFYPASNRIELKSGRPVKLTTLLRSIVSKSWSCHLLLPSGFVQALLYLSLD